MIADFEVVVLDLHNTIFDEVMEYGLAIDAAIVEILKFCDVSREQLYAELSDGHKKLGSDWDDDVWKMLPCLAGVPDDVINRAVELRKAKSRELTLAGVYPHVFESFARLKKLGKRIYIVSEAAADVGVQALVWLRLEKFIDGIYSYPSRHAPVQTPEMFHKSFAKNGDSHLVKPNPLLLAQVALDDAKICGKLAADVTLEDVATLEFVPSLMIDESLAIQKDIAVKLVVRNDVVQHALDQMIYIGDSKFKDGIMARNAGVKFAYAAYGKVVVEENKLEYEKSKDILYAVTGWDKATLKLTQEASASAIVSDLKPDYILFNNIEDIFV